MGMFGVHARACHWFFFAQTEKPAERFISADPNAWYTALAYWPSRAFRARALRTA